MADLMLKGPMATIYLMTDVEDDIVVAACVEHLVSALEPGGGLRACSWTERYDTLDTAAERAAGHADRG